MSGLKIFGLMIFLVVLSNKSVYAQIPNYFDNNPEWHEQTYVPTMMGGDWFNSKYFVSGDSVVGSYTYKKIYLENDGWTVGLYGLYRQQGRAIYYCEGTTDSLFISYEKNVGDSLGGAYGSAYFSAGAVDRIDSILIGGEYRWVFHIDTLGMHQFLCIEGIGFVKKKGCKGSMFYEPYTFQSLNNGNITWDNGVFAGIDNWVEWYAENGVELWNCDILLSIEDKPSAVAVAVYPNPFSEYINIQLPSDLDVDAEIMFFNLQGEEILLMKTNGQMNLQIDKMQLPSGVYFAILKSQNGVTNLGKIISL